MAINSCEGCAYLREWAEHHPYGSTTATEYFSECCIDEVEGDEITEEDIDEIDKGNGCRFYKKREEDIDIPDPYDDEY